MITDEQFEHKIKPRFQRLANEMKKNNISLDTDAYGFKWGMQSWDNVILWNDNNLVKKMKLSNIIWKKILEKKSRD